jgi:hypothetical protein
MPHGETTFIRLILLGGFIGLAQLLISSEVITWRVLLGRMILGSASALVALTIEIRVPNAPEALVIGIAAVLSIVGYTVIESTAKAVLRRIAKGKGSTGT